MPGGNDRALALQWRAEDDLAYGNPYYRAKREIVRYYRFIL